MSAQVGRVFAPILVFSTQTVRTLDVSQQVALVQPVPQDSCGFLDGANVTKTDPSAVIPTQNTAVKLLLFFPNYYL